MQFNVRAGRKRIPCALLLAALAGLSFSPAANAIDCRKATSAIDHMICGSAKLKQADAAMGTAYDHQLKSAGDAEIRAMLVASQKRWLARRDAQLGDLDESQGQPDADGQRQILLDAIRSRTQDLSRLVGIAEGQRKFAAQFTGGPFAGFETSCDFLPGSGRYSYGCFATHSYQNKSRVCSVQQDWASGSVSETRTVSDVVDGAAKTVATCSIGGGDGGATCPGADVSGTPGRWKIVADTTATKPPAQPLPKLDADIGPDTDEPWLHACLTDPSFPKADPASDGTRKP